MINKFEEFVYNKDNGIDENMNGLVKLFESEDQFNEFLGTLAGAAASAIPWAANAAYNRYQQGKNPMYQPKSLLQRIGQAGRWVANIPRNVRLGYNNLAGKINPNDPLYDQKLQAVQNGLINPNDPKYAAGQMGNNEFQKDLETLVKQPDFQTKMDQATASRMNPYQQTDFWNQRAVAGQAQQQATQAATRAQGAALGRDNQALLSAILPVVQGMRFSSNFAKQDALHRLQKALDPSYAGTAPVKPKRKTTAATPPQPPVPPPQSPTPPVAPPQPPVPPPAPKTPKGRARGKGRGTP